MFFFYRIIELCIFFVEVLNSCLLFKWFDLCVVYGIKILLMLNLCDYVKYVLVDSILVFYDLLLILY